MKDKISISFVLPMYNEQANIADAISNIKSFAGELSDDYEIVIVDDASTDGSAEIVAEKMKEDPRIRFFRLEKNTRFGGAFAKGFKEAGKDVIMYMDSDMPVSIADIKESFPLIKSADIVTGFSKIKKGDTALRKFISTGYNFLVRSLFGLDINDINSGYKIVRREVIEGLDFVSRSPFVDVEIFLHAKKKNKKVRQFPLIFRSRSGGESHISRMPVILATFTDMLKVKIRSLKG
ncbi:MAG: glycosyltransferase family 2 protein [Candidatus Omnitrophota bacterium]